MDLLSVWQRWIVAATIVIVHTAIVFGLPVPGCRTGTVFSNFVLVDEPAVIIFMVVILEKLLDMKLVSNIYRLPRPRRTL